MRLNAVAFFGQGGLLAVAIGVVNLHRQLVAADGPQLVEHRQQVQPGLHVVFGHGGADEGLDQHRPLGFRSAISLRVSGESELSFSLVAS